MTLQPLFNEKSKEAMLKTLQEYKQNSKSAQEFYPCTQELTKWLQENEKK